MKRRQHHRISTETVGWGVGGWVGGRGAQQTSGGVKGDSSQSFAVALSGRMMAGTAKQSNCPRLVTAHSAWSPKLQHVRASGLQRERFAGPAPPDLLVGALGRKRETARTVGDLPLWDPHLTDGVEAEAAIFDVSRTCTTGRVGLSRVPSNSLLTSKCQQYTVPSDWTMPQAAYTASA